MLLRALYARIQWLVLILPLQLYVHFLALELVLLIVLFLFAFSARWPAFGLVPWPLRIRAFGVPGVGHQDLPTFKEIIATIANDFVS